MNHRGALIGEISKWSMINRVSVALSFVSDYRTGCWNVSHRQQLNSPIIIIVLVVVIIIIIIIDLSSIILLHTP